MLSSGNENNLKQQQQQQASKYDVDITNSSTNRQHSLFGLSASDDNLPFSSVKSLIKTKLTSGNAISTPGNRNENKLFNSMMNHRDKLAKNLLRRQATVCNGEGSQSMAGGSTICQRCQRFEIDLTNTSDNLNASDLELKASRQVISLLQRQLELFQVEKDGLEKLIISQANNYEPQHKPDELIDLTGTATGNHAAGDNSQLTFGVSTGASVKPGTTCDGPADELQRKLLTLIKTQLYAKDEEIVKLKFSLKEAQNEKEQLSLQVHNLEYDVSKYKAELSLLRENLALRDQTIISLSNEVFEQSSPTYVAKKEQRRQTSADIMQLPIGGGGGSSNRLHQKQLAKLNETLEDFRKTNELLSKNVVTLTERCCNTERREMEYKSQAQESEARCCQIQSKLLSLLKEIEQSSQQAKTDSATTTGSCSGPSDEFIQNEPVRLLIKRLLEDKSLDIPLSWKEGNRSRVKAKSDGLLEDFSRQECDELGFYIVTNDKSKKSASGGDIGSSSQVDQIKVGSNLRRGISEWGSYVSQLAAVEEAHVADEFMDEEFYRNRSVDSAKKDETQWRLLWDDFIKDLDKINLAKSKEFKSLLRSGVPQEYRCKVWKALIDLKIGNERKAYGSDYYQSLLEPNQSLNGSRQQSGHMNPSSKQIELDLLRTLPNNKYFETIDSPGTVRLKRVLVAFAAHKPHIGYCQGMNRLAAVALLVLPEEEAFWCLVSIIDKIMPIGYYNDLWLAQVDSNVVMDFVAIMLPDLCEHFRKHTIELSLFAWFLTIFVDGTPPALFLRLWDCFLYEGDKILFRIALALLKSHEYALLKLNSSVAINNYLRSSVGAPMDYDRLFHIAFEKINPLPGRLLRSKRETNFETMRASIRPTTTSGVANKESRSISPADNTIDGRYSQQDDSPNEDSSIISI